jgi:hypothetical protein
LCANTRNAGAKLRILKTPLSCPGESAQVSAGMSFALHLHELKTIAVQVDVEV